jgi:uncharacterized protein DUF1707
MAQPPAIRASDAEREAVAARLRTAAGEGRLEPDELDERLGIALAARTRAELDPLVADLPGRRQRPSRRLRVPRVGGRVAAYVAGNAALVGLWMADVGARDPLLVGNSDFFWPIVPIVASAAAILAKRRRPRLLA